MSMLDLLKSDDEAGGMLKGVAVATVTNNKDPNNMGRVKVKFPWRDGNDESYWARIAMLMAGNDRGSYFLPEVGDEVLVAFERGDICHPYIVGALWNGQDKPPETNSDGKNNIRVIKSRSGHKIILDDTEGSEKIELIDKTEKNSITIDSKSNTITIACDADIVMKAPNGKISLDCSEFQVKSKMNSKIESSANLDLKASANTTVKGAIVMIN